MAIDIKTLIGAGLVGATAAGVVAGGIAWQDRNLKGTKNEISHTWRSAYSF